MFTAAIQFDDLTVTNGKTFIVGNQTFKFIAVKDQILNGTKTVKVIDKGFVSSKEFKKNNITSANSKSGKVYHVTI